MSGLRAGGLAMIIGGHPGCIGMVVTTERLVGPNEIFLAPNGKRYRNPHGSRWLVVSDKLKQECKSLNYVYGFALVYPQHLMPIDGEDFSHERTEEYVHVYGH